MSDDEVCAMTDRDPQMMEMLSDPATYFQNVTAERDRLIKALHRRNDPPTDERLADLLKRSHRNNRVRSWRIVGALVRRVQALEAERDEARARVDTVEKLCDETALWVEHADPQMRSFVGSVRAALGGQT